MRKQLVGGIASLLVALSPLSMMAQTVMAQANTLDPATRATVIGVAQRVGRSVPSSPITAPVGDGSMVDESIAELVVPDDEETSEAEVDTSALSALDLTDLVEYSAQGLTFLVPADWIVEVDAGEDVPFTIEVPGTDIAVTIEADASLDFPSWLGVSLFRSQAPLLVGDSSGSMVGDASTLYTSQSLPVAKLPLTVNEAGSTFVGAMYVMAPNENAYTMVGGGIPEEWAYAEPGIDLIVESLAFDESMITAVLAGDEPLVFVDDQETLSVTAPAGWYVMSSNDETFPVIVAEPEVRYVAAVGTSADFSRGLDQAEIQALLDQGDALDVDQAQALIDTIVELMADSGSPMLLDSEGSDVFTREGALAIRLVGGADIGGGMVLPVIFYIDLRADDLAALAIFGDTESALADEATIFTLLESIVKQ